eukprot:g13534.t1 g13534   contig8:881174-882686(+)
MKRLFAMFMIALLACFAAATSSGSLSESASGSKSASASEDSSSGSGDGGERRYLRKGTDDNRGRYRTVKRCTKSGERCDSNSDCKGRGNNCEYQTVRTGRLFDGRNYRSGRCTKSGERCISNSDCKGKNNYCEFGTRFINRTGRNRFIDRYSDGRIRAVDNYTGKTCRNGVIVENECECNAPK